MSAEIRLGPGGAERTPPELDPKVARGDDDAQESHDLSIDDERRAEFGADELADARGDGLAARVRAKREERLGRTEWFDVPGWGGDLQIQVRPYSRRRELQGGVKPEKFIIGATQAIRFRDAPDDPWEEIPGKWGKELARMMGVEEAVGRDPAPASALVRAVMSRKVGDEWVENPAAIDAFSLELMGWMTGEIAAADDAVGEA